MLKKLLIAGFAWFLGSGGVQAENIRLSTPSLANPPGSNYTRETVGIDGDFLLTGSGYVAIGTFKRLDDAAVAAAGDRFDWTALIADFQQFGNAGGIPNFAGVEFGQSVESSDGARRSASSIPPPPVRDSLSVNVSDGDFVPDQAEARFAESETGYADGLSLFRN